MTGALSAKACQQGPVVKTAAGYEMEATCKIGEMTSKSKSIVTALLAGHQHRLVPDLEEA